MLTDVACVIVTRGNVPLEPVIESLPAFREVVVWDERDRGDALKVYGRYAAIAETTAPLIYTQDDDAVCPATDLLATYMSEQLLVNIDADEDWPWVAWGALFPRDAPASAFDRYRAVHGQDDLFLRWADVIFAELTPWARVALGHENLPWAYAENRMYRQPDHYATQNVVRERCRALA